ncbi:MAG: hypothetical protein GOMPHAMPRED_001672 [Gomphillus americanus]|uniref:Uncharacterized protein n=1 Tax=Gomphillus americanus TaxID=1940652 RepID=A0A8H3F8Q0_9LECA|nr:MAG: hypothetical protein GOMPHAMPRED_001672 [Gomphillus americanus]
MSRETIKKTATESSSKLGAASGKNGATRQADILETVCRQENISGLDSDQFKEFSKLVKPVLADSLEQRDFQVTGPSFNPDLTIMTEAQQSDILAACYNFAFFPKGHYL